jgi:hypothetical protein
MRQQIIDALSPAWVGVVLSLFGTLLSVAVAVWQDRRARATGRLAFRISRWNSRSLTESGCLDIVIWNDGGKVLRCGDFAIADPLRVEFADHRDASAVGVLHVTDPHMGFGVERPTKQGDSRVALRFDYWDPGEGVRLRVKGARRNQRPLVKGTIVGTKRGLRDCGDVGITEAIWDEAIHAVRGTKRPRLIGFYIQWLRIGVPVLSIGVGAGCLHTFAWIATTNAANGNLTPPAKVAVLLLSLIGVICCITFITWNVRTVRADRAKTPKQLAWR